DLRSARQRVYLSSGFATRALVGPQQGATLGAGSSRLGRASAEFPCPACYENKRAFARGGPTGNFRWPGFYTFQKSSLLPKARDVTYRQRKCLSVLACDAFGADLNCSESSRGSGLRGPGSPRWCGRPTALRDFEPRDGSYGS